MECDEVRRSDGGWDALIRGERRASFRSEAPSGRRLEEKRVNPEKTGIAF